MHDAETKSWLDGARNGVAVKHLNRFWMSSQAINRCLKLVQFHKTSGQIWSWEWFCSTALLFVKMPEYLGCVKFLWSSLLSGWLAEG